MRALSLHQPAASMIANGLKLIETRTWPTEHRGKLLICSTKEPVHPIGPSGCAVAIVEVVDCRPMTKDDEDLACCKVYPNAYAWILKNVQKLENPFPVKGQQGIYEVDDAYIEANLKIEKKKLQGKEEEFVHTAPQNSNPQPKQQFPKRKSRVQHLK